MKQDNIKERFRQLDNDRNKLYDTIANKTESDRKQIEEIEKAMDEKTAEDRTAIKELNEQIIALRLECSHVWQDQDPATIDLLGFPYPVCTKCGLGELTYLLHSRGWTESI